MTAFLRALRRRILTPDTSETLMSVRGFHVKSDDGRELLETVGAMFIKGYSYAAEAKTVADCEARLEDVPRQFKGFAYEGAGMAYAIRDGLPFGHGHHFADFIAGRAKNHNYMAYIGIGWALARLPKFRWRRFRVDDPLMAGLVLDGYGFHQAYFHTDKYVRGQQRDARFPWPWAGPRAFADRAIDQGIGRAMWFVGGTDPKVVADMIDEFPADRREDLYAGAGLAASYAGGVGEADLRYFLQRAGSAGPQVAQAAAFAATARYEADLVLSHTLLAARVFCGLTPEQAAQVCLDARTKEPWAADPHPYEQWRQRIADALVATREPSP